MIAQACGALAALLGFLAIAGWVLRRLLLASVKQGWIPMAPSTALLFVVFGGAVFLVARAPQSRVAHQIGSASACISVLAGLVLFVLSYQGIYLDAEKLGITITRTVAGAPVGHMSPVTALGFLIGGLSLGASLLSSSLRTGPAIAGFWLAGTLVVGSVVFVLTYLFGIPLLYWGSLIPPALTTCVACAALGVSLFALAGARIWALEPQYDAPPGVPRFFVLVFALLAASFVTGGGLYSRALLARNRTEAERLLSAVVELKVRELVNWRAEHLDDAILLHQNALFAGLVHKAFGVSRNAQALKQLAAWLRELKNARGYRQVFLFDARGIARISLPGASPDASELAEARRALEAGRVRLEDFHRDDRSGAPALSLLAPILDRAVGGRTIGIVMLEIDPDKNLYPLVERWPTHSTSAETLLVRRDGDDVLFLNELRLRSHTALSLRFPLTRTDLLAAEAALGHEGIIEGTDYRGVPAMAAAHRVPGTPWFLVARVSTHELFEATFESLALLVGVVAILLFSAGMALAIIWRQQRQLYVNERSRLDELEGMTRRLTRSNMELEQFAYVASHDLQEPLRMVVGFVQLLQRRLADRLDAETREFMTFAVDGALRMQGLIQDILKYSRVTTRGLPLTPVDSAAAVKEALDRLAGRIAETGAEVNVQALPIVMADRTQLVQLFQNLIGNAIKFCKDPPRVQVAAACEAGRWRFSVTDNGIGIAPEYRGQLFVIFKRLHSRREYPGTGIGLAICKRIVERHGGEIGIDAAPDGGSVFWFTLAGEKSP